MLNIFVKPWYIFYINTSVQCVLAVQKIIILHKREILDYTADLLNPRIVLFCWWARGEEILNELSVEMMKTLADLCHEPWRAVIFRVENWHIPENSPNYSQNLPHHPLWPMTWFSTSLCCFNISCKYTLTCSSLNWRHLICVNNSHH